MFLSTRNCHQNIIILLILYLIIRFNELYIYVIHFYAPLSAHYIRILHYTRIIGLHYYVLILLLYKELVYIID